MNVLKAISTIALVVGLLIVALGLIAPNKLTVERTIIISAPMEAVFPQVRYWAKWRAWSPWTERDPSMHFVITGKDGTVGATYIWTGDPQLSGQGKMETIGLKQNEEMVYHMRFLVPYESEAFGYFRVKEVAGGTRVTWGFHGRNRFPAKLFLLFMDMEGMLAKDFDRGLERLKEIVEKVGTA